MIPVCVGQQDAIDADTGGVQLVARRDDFLVSEQRRRPPGHVGAELGVDVAPQASVEE